MNYASIIKEKGYVRIPNSITSEEQVEIEKFLLGGFLDQNYTEDNLMKQIQFKRLSGDNRQGDAFMVSKEKSQLCSIIIENETIQKCLELYHNVLSDFSGENVTESSRSMMNVQQYFQGSQEVVEHFDGLFLDFDYKDTSEMILKEGLLPQLVCVIVLRNENTNGTYVRFQNESTIIPLENKSLDTIIFDNVRMRHGVPELKYPRMMIGFRNFDHNPYYFNQNEFEGSSLLEDKINQGYIKQITQEESISLQENFVKNEKEKLKELIKKAAF